jgi:hypothetical protein
MEIKGGAKVGLLMFGFIFGWAALFLMLANFFEVLPTGVIAGSAFWALFAVCAVMSYLFLGVGFGAEIME